MRAVPRSSLAVPGARVHDAGTRTYSRRHIDLQRVAGCLCPADSLAA